MKIDLKSNEVVIRAANTLHTTGTSESKGKLIMTNQRIYFKSLGSPSGIHDLELLPGEIKDILLYNVLRIIPRGFDLVTTDGRQLRFALKNRNEWCRHIASMC